MAIEKSGDKKKIEPKEVENMRRLTQTDAAAVAAAAKRLFGKRDEHKLATDLLNGDFEDTKNAVNEADRDMNAGLSLTTAGFADANNNDIDVRVMRVGPNGQLTDVSDRINARDLRPEQIADVRLDGKSLPVGSDGRIDKDAALSLLAQIISGSPFGSPSENAMRRMEAALAKSDRILAHFKE